MTFSSGASAFQIDTAGNSFSFVGVGIVNNSNQTQTIINHLDGTTNFFNSSTAGNATITNNGSTIAGGNGGFTEFFSTSTAGDATITNKGSTIGGGGGGFTDFGVGTSNAGNATLIANGGSGGGFGAMINFFGDSTGGTARVEVFGNGGLDISPHSGGVTIGSIEGDGDVFLGANNLTVGSNNLSTLFSGVIQDGGQFGGTGGSLTKDGTGTLTLSGTNTFTGLTTVSAGILNIQNGSALGATTVGTVVLSNATLQLQGGISVGTESLLIEGVGATGQNGALVNVSGTNNYSGLLGLEGDSTISSDAGTLNLTNPGRITGTEGQPFDLTLTGDGDGTISSIIGIGSGTLAKSGTGTWTLTGANTYTGATSISAGILNIQAKHDVRFGLLVFKTAEPAMHHAIGYRHRVFFRARASTMKLVFVDCQLGLKEGKMKGSTKPQRMDEPFYS
jgi:autotransporter-associated beta strand protein